MTPFRQLIKPGQSGRDVKAVKLAYRKLGVKGSGSMTLSRRAGPAFVAVTKTFQRHNHLSADGVYGKATHEKLAPHFTTYMAMLYRTARLRGPVTPPVSSGSAQALAKRLLVAHSKGEYRADNPGDLHDIQATAEGKAVWSQAGVWVHIDKRVFEVLLWLIDSGYGPIGTYAICSDHHNDGPHGHAGGKAVDLSTVKGTAVASHAGRSETLAVATALHSKRPAILAPRQLICDGYGNMHDPAISALTIPSAAFYGSATMTAHRNHIHVGY